MSLAGTLTFCAFLVASIVQYATRLAALNEAGNLRGRQRYADDKRFEAETFSQQRPGARLDLLWGSLEGLPTSLRQLIKWHRTVAAIAALCFSAFTATFIFHI